MFINPTFCSSRLQTLNPFLHFTLVFFFVFLHCVVMYDTLYDSGLAYDNWKVSTLIARNSKLSFTKLRRIKVNPRQTQKPTKSSFAQIVLNRWWCGSPLHKSRQQSLHALWNMEHQKSTGQHTLSLQKLKIKTKTYMNVQEETSYLNIFKPKACVFNKFYIYIFFFFWRKLQQ